jgi:probable HAF family extracellular repeat protein
MLLRAFTLIAAFVALSSPLSAGFYSFTVITPPGASSSMPTGINNAGDFVGLENVISPPSTQSFRFSGGSYSTIAVPGATRTLVSGINGQGQYVGAYFTGPNLSAFAFMGGMYQTLTPPNVQAGTTSAVAINDVGQVLLNSIDNNVNNVNFVYKNSQYTLLTALLPADPNNPSFAFASGINNAATIVGAITSPSQVTDGFILQGNQVTTIDDPNASNGTLGLGTIANAINNSGQVAGYYTDANFVAHGFVYDNGAFTTVDAPLGAGGTQIFGINDSGQLVGQFFDANGDAFGFLATPVAAVPEPSSLTMLAIAGVAVAGGRLRRRLGKAPGAEPASGTN